MKRQLNLPLVLGPAGALPIIIATLVYLNDAHSLMFYGIYLELESFIVVYAIAIIAFNGGINWGFATLLKLYAKINQSGEGGNSFKSINLKMNYLIFVWSNIATLLAICVFFLNDFLIKISLLALIFVLQLIVDLKAFKTALVPEWFQKMRFISTVLITTPLIIIILAT